MVLVHAANIQDRDGVKLDLEKVKGTFSRLQLIWADADYTGQLVDWVKLMCGWVLEVVKLSDDVKDKGFKVLSHRWVMNTHLDGWVDIDV